MKKLFLSLGIAAFAMIAFGFAQFYSGNIRISEDLEIGGVSFNCLDSTNTAELHSKGDKRETPSDEGSLDVWLKGVRAKIAHRGCALQIKK